MTVGIPRRDELVLIQVVLFQIAVDVVPGADQLVVAVRGEKAITGLALALPAGERAVDQRRWSDFEAAAKPAAEQGRLSPFGPAHARTVRRLLVTEAGVAGRDAAVDNTDDDVLAAQAQVAAQTAILRRQAEKAGTVVGLDELGPVFPDVADVSPGPQLPGLRGSQARGETVERVAVAVELVVACVYRVEHLVVLRGKSVRVTANRGI